MLAAAVSWFLAAAVAGACRKTSPPPHRRIIVTSDGLTTAALKAEFEHMLGTRSTPRHLWYVPTAAFGQGLPLSFVEGQVASLRQNFGFSSAKILDVAKTKGKALVAELSSLPSVDAIYLEYGNTYYLRHHLRESGADDLIRQFLDAGAVLVGSSAGSIVLGKTVQTAFWKNWDDRTAGGSLQVDWSNPALAVGLDLLGGRSILPHADGQFADVVWQREQQRFHGHDDHEVVALADGQGLVLGRTAARVVG